MHLYGITLPDVPGLHFRTFAGAADFPLMVAVIESSKLADKIERSDTVEEIANNYAHLVNCDPYQDMVMAEVNGELVGYGRCAWRQEADGKRIYYHIGFLNPAWRRRGIGTAMLHWFQARLRVIAAEHPEDGPRFYESWVADTEHGVAALLEANGYTPIRYGFEMVRRNLDEVPPVDLPAGLEMRPVLPEHYRAIWDASDEAFRDHWGYTPPDEADYEAWLKNPVVFTPQLWQVAWDGDQVAGQVRNFINQQENEEYGRKRGYTEFISVRRPWRRRGLACALILRSLRLLHSMGMEEAALGVDAENLSGALRVYESCGFTVVKRFATYRCPLT